MGMHGYMQGHSDKMWENGKSLMKYILKRGGRTGKQFAVRSHLDFASCITLH
jgi:hypothetical protein